ncbi:YHYH protein [Massilia sp. TS11]|uniref:YHYH protein n=1 Tax=Massilia sp. TS11 TaxID=2908003 RepID=UPI001EDA9C6D|nr:YHYH protein [Massilia sp. TS11]MCG2586574.1 YHYH protein [Massilia sp. TS11]
MQARYFTIPVLLSLAACGAGSDSPTASGSGTRLLAAIGLGSNSASTVAFPGNRASYSISISGSSVTITDIEGNGGSTTLSTSQRAQFADQNLAFDTEGIPGQIYRLYQAAFSRVPDAGGLGFWISVMDNGASLGEIAAGFTREAEFTRLFGASTDSTAFVTALYRNALHREPDSGGLAYWKDILDKQKGTASAVFLAFSESAENKAGTAAALAGGISYTPVSRIAGSTVPGAPSLSALSGGDASATLVFSSPASDGGSAITGYTATCAGGGVVKSASGTGSPLTVSGLSNGVEASCTVKATNALGNSAASSALAVTPVAAPITVSTPGAPTLAGVTAGNGSATLVFVAPSNTGGAPISSYAASCSAGAVSQSASGTGTPITVTGLVNGSSYLCSVRAINSAGAGSASNAVAVTPLAPVTISVPSAPTIGTATAGNGSASISFTAPSSNGGASITAYTASCAGGGLTRTGTGSASPITVSSLSNGTSYACSVTATNSAGTGAASASVNVTPSAGTSSGGSSTITGNIYCPYSHSLTNTTVNLPATVSISCSGSTRNLTGNGVPDHTIGTFPNSGNPNAVKAVTVQFAGTLNPATTGSTTAVDHVIGYAYNGVKFDPATAESYQNAGVWKIEALNQSYFPFGVDSNNAHVQPDGAYHYHGMPEGILTKLNKGKAMTLVGFAIDGFPIYARYGYSTAMDSTSAIKVISSSYRLKSTPSSGRPSTSSVPMGTFTQDYEYVAGLGDLDECNGRTGVTPEFPNGIYHYYITDAYPYIQRCVKGTAALAR